MDNKGLEQLLKAASNVDNTKKPTQQDIDLAQQFARLLSQGK